MCSRLHQRRSRILFFVSDRFSSYLFWDFCKCCYVSGVDLAFEALLCEIFGGDFIHRFKVTYPSAFVDLMISFEARKRNLTFDSTLTVNISLPFAFITSYEKWNKGAKVSEYVCGVCCVWT